MRIFISLILVAGLSSIFGQTQIAIVNFKSEGVTNQESRALTGRLASELHRTGKFIVLEREMLDKILEEQKFQLSGCTTNECLVEIGRLANVQKIVGGNVSKVGKVFSVDAKMVDVETGIIIATALYDYQGDIGELMIQGMKEIAKQLSGIEQIEAVSPKSKSPVIVQKKPPLEETSVKTSIQKNEGEVLETVLTKPPTKEENVEEITEFVNTGYTVGVMGSYPLWMSPGLADGKASPVFGVVVSTPFGVAVGPIKMGMGAKLGMFDFSDKDHGISGVILITTLNMAIMETTRGAISAEAGGGYYGASLGVTAGIKYSYTIDGVPLILEPHFRFNATVDSAENDIGSIGWLSAGMYLSYDLGSLF